MTQIEEFEELRPLLFTIAYEILGSTSEAEDVLREAWLRYEAIPTVPASAETFLSAEVTRISMGVMRSSRVRREKDAELRLPEPLPRSPEQDLDQPEELAKTLSAAALLLLERLSPPERAVFALREIFGCDLSQIASTMGYSEAACRQLAASVSMVTEGESRALPWPRHIVGRNNVARLFAAIGPAMNRIGVIMDLQQVNCPPSAVFRDRNGKALGAFALDILDGRIQRIRWVDHPNSLGIR